MSIIEEESNNEKSSSASKKIFHFDFIINKMKIINLKHTIQKFGMFRILLKSFSERRNENIRLKKENEKNLKIMVTKIQKIYKGFFVRRKLKREKKIKDLYLNKVIFIQKWNRSYFYRKKLFDTIDNRRKILIENKIKNQREEGKVRVEKIKIIQRMIKAFLKRKKIKILLERERKRKEEIKRKLLERKRKEVLFKLKIPNLVIIYDFYHLKKYFNKFKKFAYFLKEMEAKQLKQMSLEKEKFDIFKKFLNGLKRKIILKNLNKFAKEYKSNKKNIKQIKNALKIKKKEKEVKNYDNLAITTSYNFEISLKKNKFKNINKINTLTEKRTNLILSQKSINENKPKSNVTNIHKKKGYSNRKRNSLPEKRNIKSLIETNNLKDKNHFDNTKNKSIDLSNRDSNKEKGIKYEFTTPRSGSTFNNRESAYYKSIKGKKVCLKEFPDTEKKNFDSNYKKNISDQISNYNSTYNSQNNDKNNDKNYDKNNFNIINSDKNKTNCNMNYKMIHFKNLIMDNEINNTDLINRTGDRENKNNIFFSNYLVNNTFQESLDENESENKISKNLFFEKFMGFSDENDELKFFEDRYLNMLALFPNYHLKMNKNDIGSLENINNLLNLQLKYEKKLINFNPNIYYQTSYLNISPYDEPKLHFFAYILDLDNLTANSDIYQDVWGMTLKDFLRLCAINKNPIQLIEITGYNTNLLSSSGKVYSWGWGLKSKKNSHDGHSQYNNDVEIEFENKKDNVKNKNRNNEVGNANRDFINETNLNLNLNTNKDISVEYIDKEIKYNSSKKMTNKGNTIRNKVSTLKNNKNKEKINIPKNNNVNYDKFNNNINNKNNENTRISPSLNKSPKTINEGKSNFKNNNDINKMDKDNKFENEPNEEKTWENCNYINQENSNVNNIKKQILNSRNSDMILKMNYINEEVENDLKKTDFGSLNTKAHINMFCDINNTERQSDSLNNPFNEKNTLTFYDKNNHTNNLGNNLENGKSEKVHKENNNNITHKKKDLENFYKKNFDFKIPTDSKIHNYQDKIFNSDNVNKTTINQIDEFEDKNKNEIEYEIKKNKLINQIFENEIIHSELISTKNEFEYAKFPILIDNFQSRSISASHHHVLYLSKNNSNLLFTGNNENNNFAYGNKIFIKEPIDYFSNIKNQLNNEFENLHSNPNTSLNEYENLIELTEDIGKKLFNKMKVISAKSFGKGFIFLDDKGQAFYITDNICKKLIESIPILLNINNVKFTQVECGRNFCIFLSNSGLIYSQGENKNGELGQGDFDYRSNICEIPNLKEAGIKTVQISCGYKHVVIRTSSSKIFTWGNVKNFFTFF